jgi:monoamine oxidase
MGLSPVFLTLDVGGGDVSEGELAGFLPVNGEIAARYSDELSDPERAKELFLRQSAEYLGDGAAEPNEVYGFGWLSDSWSTGCSVGLPPGVLSTVGSALRRPIPPVFWAGEETGAPQNDWMEGAVSAGERAAVETINFLGAGDTG